MSVLESSNSISKFEKSDGSNSQVSTNGEQGPSCSPDFNIPKSNGSSGDSMNVVDFTVSDEINKKSSNNSSMHRNKNETCSLKRKSDENDSFKKYKATMTSSSQFQATGKTMSMKQRNYM